MENDHIQHLNELIAHNTANPEQRSVKIRYHKMSTKRHVNRKVSPLKLNGNLLIAYDHKRKALRSFKTDRIKSMEKEAFWRGFDKRANAALELLGLGTLMVPSIQSLRGKPMKEHHKDLLEIGGLGVLAAPYVKPAFKGLASKVAPHLRTIGKSLLKAI